MFVVIDSNIIIANYNLKNSDFLIFCKHFPEKNIDVFVSKISMEEVVKNHKKYILKFEKEYNASVRGINNGSTGYIEPLPKNYSITEHEKYKSYLSDVLSKNKIKRLDYPKVSHEEVVKYSITGRKPFNERVIEEPGKKKKVIEAKDMGYKDFLIWSSIIELLAKSKRPLVFITNDTDFTKDKKLHPDLREHLRENSISDSQVEICSSFHEFNDNYLREVYKIVELKELLKTPELQKELEQNAKDKLETFIQNYDIQDVSGLRQEFENPTISGMLNCEKFEIQNVEIISEDQIIIGFEARINCQVDFYVFKSDLYTLPENEMPYIIDGDWNDHYVLAEENYNFRVVCSFSSDLAVNVTDFSIDLIEKE